MRLFHYAAGIVLTSAIFASCFKNNYDSPPATKDVDPNLPVTCNIAQINNIANNMQSSQFRTMGDTTIYGVVVADDRSGNFYKTIIIQDSTGGIAISLSQTYLYNDFPVGRKVYVKLKGLTLINYHGLPEIGFSASTSGSVSLAGIPSVLIKNYVIKASYPNTIDPTVVRIVDLFGNPNKYLNTLVRIDSMEFDSLSVGVPYAGTVASGTVGTSRTIRDCPFHGSMVMYNSAYAWFQPTLTPSGRGSITGIFSMYSSPQFLIRDTTDVQLTGARVCP